MGTATPKSGSTSCSKGRPVHVPPPAVVDLTCSSDLTAHDGDCRKDAPKRTATHFDDHDVIDIIDLGSVLDAESVNLHAAARSIDSSHGCGADMQVGLAPSPPSVPGLPAAAGPHPRGLGRGGESAL